MAARETQVLHIALIIFVGLTVVLFVVSFFIFRNYQESQDKLKLAQVTAAKAEKDMKETLRDQDQLKSRIGAAGTDSVATIDDTFKKDMAKYAPAFPPEKQTYRNVIEYVQSQFLAADQGRIEVADQVKTLKAQIEQAALDRATAEKVLNDNLKKVEADRVEERDKFNKSRNALEAEKTALAGEITKKSEEVKATAEKKDLEVAKVKVDNDKLTTINKGLLADRTKELESNELPDGEVRWVDQRLRTVWINRGSDDKLPKQVSFSVVGKDETNMSTAKKKAKLEVTRIVDRHLAEARIVEDKYENPIMPGDLIFSPVWQPGEGTHFALAGFMDIDEDGESDRDLVKELILHAGGVIDAEATDSGEKVGAITVGTRYLVLGEKPTDKSTEKTRSAYGKIKAEQEEYGIRTMSLRELLDQMGFKTGERSVLLGHQGDDIKEKKELKKQAIAKQESRTPTVTEKPKPSEFKPRLPAVKRGFTY